MRRRHTNTNHNQPRAFGLSHAPELPEHPWRAKSAKLRPWTGKFETFPGHQDTDKIMTQDTRIIDLTVAQLMEVIDKAVEESLRRRQQSEQTRRYVYGIQGIAELFGVSERQARYIKSSGAISKAIRQQGRTIVTDADLALQLFGKHS